MIAKFSSAADLMAHYAALKDRLRGPEPKPFVHAAALPKPGLVAKTVPEPVVVPAPPLLPIIKMSTFVALPHEIRISFEEITIIVCAHTKFHRREIFAPRRTHDICYARQLLWALARKYCWHMSLPQIGRASGGKDHTTILHGCKKGEKHPLFNELCEVFENLYEEKRRANNELIAQAEMEKEGV